MQNDAFNVLVCGKVRNTGEFIKTLEKYKKWKQENIINRVVYSGWISDYVDVKEYITDSESWGLECIFSEEPNIKTNGHIFHQQKSLRYGLSLFNKHDKVLKSRTDKAFLDLDLVNLQKTFDNAPAPSANSPFKRRILIVAALIMHPFFFIDIGYAGEAQDLIKLSSSDLWYHFYNTCINAEQAIHSAPFIANDDLLRNYFMVNPGLIQDNYDSSLEMHKKMLHSPFFIQALARSFVALRDSYIIGIKENADWTPPENINFISDLVDKGKNLDLDGIRFDSGANSILLFKQEAFDYVSKLPLSPENKMNIIESMDIKKDDDTLKIISQEAEDFAKYISDFMNRNPFEPPKKINNAEIITGRISVVN
jgi:hypothetical protein